MSSGATPASTSSCNTCMRNHPQNSEEVPSSINIGYSLWMACVARSRASCHISLLLAIHGSAGIAQLITTLCIHRTLRPVSCSNSTQREFICGSSICTESRVCQIRSNSPMAWDRCALDRFFGVPMVNLSRASSVNRHGG